MSEEGKENAIALAAALNSEREVLEFLHEFVVQFADDEGDDPVMDRALDYLQEQLGQVDLVMRLMRVPQE